MVVNFEERCLNNSSSKKERKGQANDNFLSLDTRINLGLCTDCFFFFVFLIRIGCCHLANKGNERLLQTPYRTTAISPVV